MSSSSSKRVKTRSETKLPLLRSQRFTSLLAWPGSAQNASELHHVLAAGSEQPRAEVCESLHSLIAKVVLTPVDGVLGIDFHGEIAET
jgi:hypothetical protein